jgi:hypothetical protein
VLGVSSTSTAPRGAVDYAKLLLRWREAQQQTAANLATLGTSLLALDEVKLDPRLPQVQRAAAMLSTLVPQFGEALADQLDTAMTKGAAPEGKAAVQAALKTIESYRSLLGGVPALLTLEGFAKRAVGSDLKFHGLLDATLTELQGELAVRAV